MAVFVIVWRYVVLPELVDDFVAAYGPDGPWVELFSRSPGFVGVELVADDASGGFVTIDRWQDEAAWRGSMDAHRSDYDALDVRLEPLTVSELLVARGIAVGRGPD
jgi:hypothetical protein